MARILHVVRPSAGGAFGHVLTLSSEFASRGYEVAICGPSSQLERELPVPHLTVEMPREISPIADAIALRSVAAAIRSFRPDLIHLHGSQAGVLGRLARAARPGSPVIHTPHQYAFVNYFAGGDGRSRAYRLIERALVPLTTRILCVCEAERRLALEIGAGERAVVVHNGIEPLTPGSLQPAIATWAGEARLVVALAELHERKGLSTLIEAMPAIRSQVPAAKLVIAGEGPERPRLETQIADLGLGEAVLLPGRIDGVGGLLAAADVFVNPAWAEAFPYAVLEAMSLGLPSVVTDVGGTAEAIEDGSSGIVVPARDPRALAESISLLLRDRDLAGRLGASARQRLLQNFTRERMIEGTLAVYGEAGLPVPL